MGHLVHERDRCRLAPVGAGRRPIRPDEDAEPPGQVAPTHQSKPVKVEEGEWDVVETLTETARGAGGFGSTGRA